MLQLADYEQVQICDLHLPRPHCIHVHKHRLDTRAVWMEKAVHIICSKRDFVMSDGIYTGKYWFCFNTVVLSFLQQLTVFTLNIWDTLPAYNMYAKI